MKSNKVVNFPMENFDPSEFVVKRSCTEGYDSVDNSGVRTFNVKTADKDETMTDECCQDAPMETTCEKVRNVT